MEYMSQGGYDELSNELNDLIKVRLPEAIQAISEARDKGDLSENYEYRAAKREHGRILRRINFLQKRAGPRPRAARGTAQQRLRPAPDKGGNSQSRQ